MDFKALEENVQVPRTYVLRFSEVVELQELAAEKGMATALFAAFLAGWKRRDNKEKNDARREGRQDLRYALQAARKSHKEGAKA